MVNLWWIRGETPVMGAVDFARVGFQSGAAAE
jgi:hypothetical protein